MLENTDDLMTTYVEAADEFARSAKEFLLHVHLLSRSWDSYQQALAASAELRRVLDTSDENLRMVMAQLEEGVSSLSGKSVPSERKPEDLKAEVMKASVASAGAASASNVKVLP
jgi:uncharacterized protein YdaU (DUF1376 family)